ncbi:mucin-13 [Arvicanthis niloticus]|uniref:mucin-13 n=1 Tax=Arvicanthis niloticus TaxID=61156 RepID=UPI0014865646|nr:mucin-13 [Arvicanthis niloticus]
MKGFLLLSLGLLLVISGNSSSQPNSRADPSNSGSNTTTSAPTTTTSAPTTTTSAPTTTTSAPTTTTSAPTTTTSAPTTTTSAPTTTTSAPTTPTSAPTTPTSGSTTPTSASTTPTSGSATTTSASTTPTSGSTTPTSGSTMSTGSSSQTSGTTQPASSSTVTSSSSTGSSDPCTPDPCKGGAACVKLYNASFCLCVEGNYYDESSSSCVKGKTFPGEITMNVGKADDLKNENSVGYQELHNSVVRFFQKTFNEPDYGQTVILKVSTAPSARSAMHDAREKANVSIVNMFAENTAQTEDTVAKKIQDAVNNDTNVDSYVKQDWCDYYGCEKNDDNCSNSLQCTCKTGMERPNPQVPFCVGVKCSEPCSAEEKKQCLKADSGAMECVCMPGYQKANGKCEECPFGYSGKDCKDSFQLILTIVGTVAGAFIIILLIAFIVSISSKNKKKNVEEQKLIEDDFHNVRMRQTGFSNFGADNSIFPKVRTGGPSQTPNPYANQRSMPRPDY